VVRSTSAVSPHFTPTSASWLNLVERWFAPLSQKQIKRGTHRSVRALETAIREYLAITNDAPRPFVWTKTADEILAKVAGFCQRISNPGCEAISQIAGIRLNTLGAIWIVNTGRHFASQSAAGDALGEERFDSGLGRQLQVVDSKRLKSPTTSLIELWSQA
jgi:hypothetical protein